MVLLRLMIKNVKIAMIIILSLTSKVLLSQSKNQYLKHNRSDLISSTFTFPQKDFKIIGYGVFHGAASSETAENILLESLVKNKKISYYLPETDFSIAYYFNEYLKSGDTILLKNLVTAYGKRVQQEKTIDTYKKWKKIKILNDLQPNDNKLEVIGIDMMVSYKYTSRQLSELLNLKNGTFNSVDQLREMVKTDTTSYSIREHSYAKHILKSFVKDYEHNKNTFQANLKSKTVFEHLITNLKLTFDTVSPINRDQIMLNNYIHLSELYSFKSKAQFVKMGFFHIEKARDENIPSFFTLLIEKGIYKKEEIISVLGYLSKSRVLWDVNYDQTIITPIIQQKAVWELETTGKSISKGSAN